ncbi:MAG: FkbM family methyltransferase [Bryobacteraceae bacterium]
MQPLEQKEAMRRVCPKGAVSVNRLTIRRRRAKLDEMNGALRRRFNLFPDLYLPNDECGDYLHPGFLMRIDANSVHAVFEVGCSDGTDTLRLAQAFPAVIHAFECNPEVLPQTRLNVSNHDRIRLVERAVWDSECRLPFFPVIASTHLGRAGHNPGASSCFRARSDYLQHYEQKDTIVNAIRLDSYCRQHGIDAIDLLCIDAQGAELQVLKGLGDLIRSVRYLITEIEVRPIYQGQALYPEIHAYLTSNGFRQAAEVYRDDWFSDYLYIRRALSG